MLQLTDDTSGGSGDIRSPGHRLCMAAVLALTLLGTTASAVTLVHSATDTTPRPAVHGNLGAPPIFALFEHDPAAQRRISVANELLVTDCMAHAGLRYESALLAQDTEQPQPEQQQPFGPESIDQLAPVHEPVAAEDPSLDTDAYLRALYGPADQRVTVRGARLEVSGPAKGCVAEAMRHLLGDDRRHWTQVKILLFEAAENARHDMESDGEFSRATRRWQDCMHAAGIDAVSPVELFANLPANQPDLRKNVPMINDIQCKQQTGYLTTAYARLSAAQQGQLDADPSMAADWMRLLNLQDTKAREVLASGR